MDGEKLPPWGLAPESAGGNAGGDPAGDERFWRLAALCDESIRLAAMYQSGFAERTKQLHDLESAFDLQKAELVDLRAHHDRRNEELCDKVSREVVRRRAAEETLAETRAVVAGWGSLTNLDAGLRIRAAEKRRAVS